MGPRRGAICGDSQEEVAEPEEETYQGIRTRKAEVEPRACEASNSCPPGLGELLGLFSSSFQFVKT